MIFWMDSKVFQNYFLTNERDDDILNAQYVVVSTRIVTRRKKGLENIVNAKAMLYPDARVCSATNSEDMMERYFKQCDGNKAFLSVVIKGVIEKGYNVIFLCTKNEAKLKYLDYLASYIYLTFGYPVYEYKLFCTGASEIMDFNPEKVIKKCDKFMKNAKKEQHRTLMRSGSDKASKIIMGDYKKKKKKELIKILKKKNLYTEGMDKEDMLEAIELFLM